MGFEIPVLQSWVLNTKHVSDVMDQQHLSP